MKEMMRKVSDCIWDVDAGLPVTPRIFLSDEMQKTAEDEAVGQLTNAASLIGCVAAAAMPDMHVGDGLPIGGVAAFSESGVITPTAVGYDINCGVRLMLSDMFAVDGGKKLLSRDMAKQIITELYKTIPSGVGPGNKLYFNNSELDEIFVEGPSALVRRGYGTDDDVYVCEENGRMKGADPKFVSDKVRDRGRSQIATLGGGNHFIEIQRVTDIYDEATAKAFGIEKGMVTVMIHSGSRGAGHQICAEYKNICKAAMPKYGIMAPANDSDLVSVPMVSPEGQAYIKAMACGANFGWTNRHGMGHFVREVFEKKGAKMKTLYDVAHNIAKHENHTINGKMYGVVVTRKGATRAFPAGHYTLPERFKSTGHPVLIPGSMGTSSYVLVGTQKAMELSLGSINHGAGRAMSRTAAKKVLTEKYVRGQLEEKGIALMAPDGEGVAEEAPEAYKDIDNVIDVVDRVGLARKVARMVPIAVMKG